MRNLTAALECAGGYGLALLLVLIFSLLPTAHAGALPAASGDAQGVSLARAVSAAFARVPAVSYEQSGFASMLSEDGARPVFSWRWGGGPVAGMVPVRERAVIGLHDGLVRWWQDQLSPLPCADAALCGTITAAAQASAVIVVTSAGTFYAFGDARRHSCFGRLGGSTPQRVGEATWSAFGAFQPPAAHGALELLKSSYPWALTGGTADEIASLSRHTHLPVRQQTTVLPPSGGDAPFSFTASFGYPSHASEPAVNLCPS